MKKTLLALLLLSACTPTEMKVIDDFVDGEVKTGEQIMKDLSSPDPLQAPVHGSI
jgi:hypothetical protein